MKTYGWKPMTFWLEQTRTQAQIKPHRLVQTHLNLGLKCTKKLWSSRLNWISRVTVFDMLLIYVNSKYGSLSFIKQYLDGYLLISIFNAALDTHTHGSPPPHPGIMDQLILTQAIECISCRSQNFQNKLKKEGIQ